MVNKKYLMVGFCCLLGIVCIFLYYISDYAYFNFYIVEYLLSFFVFGLFIVYHVSHGMMVSLEVLFNVYGILYTNYSVGQCIINNQVIDDYVFEAMLLSHLSIFVFNFAFIISGKKNVTHTIDRSLHYIDKYNVSKVGMYSFLLFILSIAAEGYVLIYKIGLSKYFLASRATKSLLSRGYSILSFYKFTIPMIACVYLYLFLKHKKKRYLSLFIFAFAISLFNAYVSASRTEMLAILLPLVFLLYYFKKIDNKTVILLGIGGILFFGAWKALLSDGNFSISFDSEFNSWYGVCQNVLSDSEFHYRYGKSYLDTIINLILPKTNTEALSEWYIKRYESKIYKIGGGRGFSGVLEAYINFGVLGNIIIYTFYGWVLKRRKMDTDLQVIIYLIIMTSLHQFFRSESYSLWKNMMWFKIYPILLIFLFSQKSAKKRYR